MNRRRMMMLRQSKPDLLEGYRLDTEGYNMYSVWLSKDTMQLYKRRRGFGGPTVGAKNFIGAKRIASTGLAYVIGSRTDPMQTLTMGKSYQLTLTITDVLNNEATADNDVVFNFGFGSSGGYSVKTLKGSGMVVGTKITLVFDHTSGWANIAGAALECKNASLLWDFIFKVELEEV